MAWAKESCCSGCAECIHCGRKFQYEIFFACDKCGDETSVTYRYDGEDLCLDCIRKELETSEDYYNENGVI